jgi:hypothetical protein
MATFIQLPSGNWRVQVRRKNRYVAETFRRRKDGEEWALDIERNIDRSGSPKPRAALRVRTFGDLIDLHVEDMQEVGRPPRRSKAAVLEALKESLGTVKLPQLNRERLIEFGRKRAKQGAGPATLAIDFAFIRTVATHAAAVHGIEVSAEEVRLARFALTHLGLVGKSGTTAEQPVWSMAEVLDRARNESIWHEGDELHAVITVQGWLRSNGDLWRVRSFHSHRRSTAVPSVGLAGRRCFAVAARAYPALGQTETSCPLSWT